jgi:hypothetical protein
MRETKTQDDHVQEVGPFLFESYAKVVAENADLRAELEAERIIAKTGTRLVPEMQSENATLRADLVSMAKLLDRYMQRMYCGNNKHQQACALIAKWLPKQEATDD